MKETRTGDWARASTRSTPHDDRVDRRRSWDEPLLRGLRCVGTVAGTSCALRTGDRRWGWRAYVGAAFVALKAAILARVASRAFASAAARNRRLALVATNAVTTAVCLATERPLRAVLEPPPTPRSSGGAAVLWVTVCSALLLLLLLLSGASADADVVDDSDWSWYAGLCYQRTACVSVAVELCALLARIRRRLRRLDGRLAALAARSACRRADEAVRLERVRRDYGRLAVAHRRLQRRMGWRWLVPTAWLPLQSLVAFDDLVDDGHVRRFALDSPVYLALLALLHLGAVLASDIRLQNFQCFRTLTTFPVAKLPAKVQLSIKLFAEQVRATRLTFTAANFLPVDKKLVISIFSLIAGYCVVILQMRLSRA